MRLQTLLCCSLTLLVAIANVGAQTWDLPLLDRHIGQPGQQAGEVIENVGDIDGDGIDDWIRAAPHADSATFTDAGLAEVVSGVDGSVLHTHVGSSASARLGTAVAGGGDVDGDGVSDYIITAPGATSGQVVVYSGATGGVLQSHPTAPLAYPVGVAADFIDDLDGDGHDDFMFSGEGPSLAGIVVVVSGATGMPFGSITAVQPLGRLGYIVKGAGDLDGDGVGDFLYAVGDGGGGYLVTGTVFVRSGIDGSVLYSIAGSAGHAFDIDAGRDATGDGVPDIVISTRFTTITGGIGPNHVRVHSGVDGQTVHSVSGLTTQDLGHSVSLTGDVNGDGVGDFGAGDPLRGCLHLYSGVDGTTIEVIDVGGHFGADHVGLGDTNGDGFGELLAADPFDSAFSGRIDHLTLGGAQPYGLAGPATQTLSHAWQPGNGPVPSLGEFVVSGAAPGNFGFYAVSIGPGSSQASGVDVLIDDSPGLFFSVLFNFDGNGELHVPADLRNPQLAPLSFNSQIFEVNANAPQFIYSSNGLDQIYTR